MSSSIEKVLENKEMIKNMNDLKIKKGRESFMSTINKTIDEITEIKIDKLDNKIFKKILSKSYLDQYILTSQLISNDLLAISSQDNIIEILNLTTLEQLLIISFWMQIRSCFL
jgi:hypothetical protein